MTRKIFLAAAFLALAIFLNNGAVAKVKKYTDDQGVLHITNSGEPGQSPAALKTPEAGGKGRRGNVPAFPAAPGPPPEPEPEGVEEPVPDEIEPPESPP